MNRPTSNKQKINGYWGYGGRTNTEQSTNQQVYTRKKAQLIKPDLTTNDFGRILPRKMYKDRQRLYSEGLQLKQAVNDISDQNVRLKTQLSMLQKQKYRISRLTQSGQSLKANNQRQPSRQLRSNQGQRENNTIRNLKRMLREYKQQNISLQNDCKKIRKTMKYIKINELQIELNVVIEENQRLGQMLQEYVVRANNSKELENSYQDLQGALQREYHNNQAFDEENRKLNQVIQELQNKARGQAEKWRVKENKLVREINQEKKKSIEQVRHIDDLRRELKGVMDGRQEEGRKKHVKSAHRQIMPQSINQAVRQSNSKSGPKSANLKINTDTQTLIKEISNLKSELSTLRKELQMERQLKKDQQSPNTIQQYSNAKLQPHKISFSGEGSLMIHNQSQINVQAVYQDDQFQMPEDKVGQNEHERLNRIKQDFQDNSIEEEELFRNESSGKSKPKAKPGRKRNNKSSAFKADKVKLAHIKELLTYRMKSQRYPFSDLEADILSSQVAGFTSTDLSQMLFNQPFYLNKDHATEFLKYCFGKETIDPTETLDNKVLIEKLKKVVNEFELISEEHQKDMIIKIAQMTSTYPRELQIAFEEIKNGEDTVSKKDLVDMFTKLSLEEDYIELIIAELTLCSEDLDHLNFHGFFERFYIKQDDLQQEAIQEEGEEDEDSYQNSSRAKKTGKKNKDSKNSLS